MLNSKTLDVNVTIYNINIECRYFLITWNAGDTQGTLPLFEPTETAFSRHFRFLSCCNKLHYRQYLQKSSHCKAYRDSQFFPKRALWLSEALLYLQRSIRGVIACEWAESLGTNYSLLDNRTALHQWFKNTGAFCVLHSTGRPLTIFFLIIHLVVEIRLFAIELLRIWIIILVVGIYFFMILVLVFSRVASVIRTSIFGLFWLWFWFWFLLSMSLDF